MNLLKIKDVYFNFKSIPKYLISFRFHVMLKDFINKLHLVVNTEGANYNNPLKLRLFIM